VKGEKVVTGEDIKLNSDVELINPEEHLATLTTKSAELTVEIKVERGLGYSPVEARKSGEKLSVGSIAIDAFFSPVVRVHYAIENMRVGDRTDYNRIRLEVETDGTISPSSALHKSAVILQDHFTKIAGLEVKQFEEEVEKKESKKKKEK
jgi:DNA-directed RNA polymerase subunit alpha